MLIENIVVATRNQSKKTRFIKLLSDMAGRVYDLQELKITAKPDETGQTAEANAEIKSKFYSRLTNQLVLSEDESLFVDFLPPDKQPGVFVRRINGRDEVSDDELLTYWEKLVAAAPLKKRFGHWHVAYSLASSNGQVRTVALNHSVMFFSPSSKVRMLHWPLSSLQGPAVFGKPDSDLTPYERHLKDLRADDLIASKLRELLKSDSTPKQKL